MAINILSFDIEEWYLETKLHGGRKFKLRQYDDCFAQLLDELDRQGIRATFFCVGQLAKEFPQVVREIAARGHEVGCHSNEHSWLDKMSVGELRADTSDAIHALEDVVGQKVRSYRAPAFSITRHNKWAVEVLAECGIEHDSSIFPAARDFGGFPSFPSNEPCKITVNGITVKEFPIAMASICGKKLAYSGGGYFRMLPYPFIKNTMSKNDYNICYFHLNDLIRQKIAMKSRKEYEEYFGEPGTLKNRVLRYVKSNIGNGDGYGKLLRLMHDFEFVAIRDAEVDWDGAKEIVL